MIEPAAIRRPSSDTPAVEQDGFVGDKTIFPGATSPHSPGDTGASTGLPASSARHGTPLETGTPTTEVTAFWFGNAARPLLGRWHRPAHGNADLAVLLCSAHGREEASSHRTLSHVAQAAASAGLHALRFDCAGCGDSAGDPSLPNLFDAWLDSIDAALDELRRLSGCRRVAIVGLRLGALLAAQVAARRGDVDVFVAIAPVVSGRGYIRELRALRAAGQAANGPPSSREDGSLESGGFMLTAATLADLSAIDLRKLDRPPARDVLIVDRDDMPSARPWAAQLTSTGGRVELQSFGGFAEMMQAPHLAAVPAGLADRVARWLGAAAVQHQDPPDRQAGSVSRDASLGAVLEQILSLPVRGADLFGIATLPARQPYAGLGLVLINAGAQGHAGPGRLYVEMARRCAALGAVVVRIDLSGLGDSPARAGSPENIVYPESALDEVADAIRHLRKTYPVPRWYAAGICSGAYHAMKASAQGASLDGVLSINPLTFFRQAGMPLDASLAAHHVSSELARYRSQPFAGHRWRKLLQGQVDLLMVGALLRQRMLTKLSAWLREAARTFHLPIKNDLALELRRHASSGTEIRFIFAASDPGEDLLRTQAGREVNRLLRRKAIAIDRVADADHIFTGMRARARLMTIVTDWVRATQANLSNDESLRG